MGARLGKLVCFVAVALMAMPVFTVGGLAQTAQKPPAAEPATTLAPATPASPETTPKQDKPKSPNDPALETVNPTRFGKGPEDDAFGAYQRGLYKTAYNLALPRAEEVIPPPRFCWLKYWRAGWVSPRICRNRQNGTARLQSRDCLRHNSAMQ